MMTKNTTEKKRRSSIMLIMVGHLISTNSITMECTNLLTTKFHSTHKEGSHLKKTI